MAALLIGSTLARVDNNIIEAAVPAPSKNIQSAAFPESIDFS